MMQHSIEVSRYQFMGFLLFLGICGAPAAHAQAQSNLYAVVTGTSQSASLPIIRAENEGAQVAFKRALREGRLLTPASTSAWELYELYIQLPVLECEKETAKDELLTALVSAGEQLLWAYRRGDQVVRLDAADYREGARLFAHASQIEPQDTTLQSKAKFMAGVAVVEDRLYSEGISLLQEAARLDPDSALSYNALGIAFMRQRRWNEAIANFKAASERAQKWVYPHYNLARVYVDQQRYGEAEEEFNKCFAIESGLGLKYSYLHYNLRALHLITNAEAPRRKKSSGALPK